MGMLAGTLFPTQDGGGVTINLANTGASDDTSGGPASVSCTAYRADHGTRAGEVWADDTGVATYQYDLTTPITSSGDYQMKWDFLSGDAPYALGSTAENTWVDLSTTSLTVTWRLASGPGTEAGTVTVSIRKGAGPQILKTAVWDGEVILSGKGK